MSSVCTDKKHNKGNVSQKVLLVDTILHSGKRLQVGGERQEGECKYCMMEEGEGEHEFLCSPCKCSGSCGLVHFSCL